MEPDFRYSQVCNYLDSSTYCLCKNITLPLKAEFNVANKTVTVTQSLAFSLINIKNFCDFTAGSINELKNEGSSALFIRNIDKS